MNLDLVRVATDGQVLDALLREGPLTRARIAQTTGVSKPTASESIRRLLRLGLVSEAGPDAGGRGRTGTLYRVPATTSLALALQAGPGEVVGEVIDASGTVRDRATRPIGAAVPATHVVDALAQVATSLEAEHGPLPNRAVSIAHPVDTRSMRVADTPGAPFASGEADLAPIVGSGVLDNDVAWAALAERAVRQELDSFLYVHLGVGLGAAIVEGGDVLRGSRGVTGEISRVLTEGPDGRAASLSGVLTGLGLTVSTGTALDVPTVLHALRDDRRDAVLTALAGAITSTIAMCDPGAVVLGGPWARADHLDDDLAVLLRAGGHDLAVVLAEVDDAPMAGVRARAARSARDALLGALNHS